MSKKLKRVCVCGHFAFGKELLNGQTVKTKIVTAGLVQRFGENEVATIDTHGGIKSMLRVLFSLTKALAKSKNIVILPAHNGVRIIAPFLSAMNRIFKRKLHYALIGGWLPSFLDDRKALIKSLMRFDGIYVETTTVKAALSERGFNNVFVMPNCKELNVLDICELERTESEPYGLCTFSRVMEEKGIEDAVYAVKKVNEDLGRTVYYLDIYGPVDEGQTEWFEKLCRTFPEYVRYKGSVPFDQSVQVLKGYFALLFPTRFYTEGIPGTVIDAYASGVPVISSVWESFGDIIDDNITGIGYDFCSREALVSLLKKIADDPGMINSKKEACLAKAVQYLPSQVLSTLADRLI